MTYPDFKESILSGMTDRYAGQASVSLTNVKKNNGVELDGLVFHEEDIDLSPTIYLDGYYDMLLNGHSYDEVFDSIVDSYESHKNTSFGAGDCFKDFNWVKKHLVMRLIHRKKNAELLSEVPYVPFLDLALVFAVRMEVKSGLFGSALIYHRHAQFWETDAMSLFAAAKRSAPDQLPPVTVKIDDIIREAIPNCADKLPMGELPMYVLSNSEHSYGASVMCYHHVIRDLSDDLDSDLIIIPSSVHELIVVPTNLGFGVESDEMNRTVCEVNDEALSPADVLSDHVYTYHRDSDRITY